ETAPAVRSGSTIAGKLGIQPGQTVAILSAPPDFMAALEPLPPGVTLRRQMSDDCDLVVWFVRARRDLQDGLALRVARLAGGRLWLLWPKKAGASGGTLTAGDVRSLAGAHGLTEEKSASIDAAWSGLLFVRPAEG